MELHLTFPLGGTGQGSHAPAGEQVVQTTPTHTPPYFPPNPPPCLCQCFLRRPALVALLTVSPDVVACRSQKAFPLPAHAAPRCSLPTDSDAQEPDRASGRLCLLLFIITAFCVLSLTPPDDNCHSSLPAPPSPLSCVLPLSPLYHRHHDHHVTTVVI